jgi:hypothetical protein
MQYTHIQERESLIPEAGKLEKNYKVLIGSTAEYLSLN